MRNDWLTIPNAPNYEINSQLICRNKKTGYVLKLHKDKRGHPHYSLRIAGSRKCFQRSPKYLLNIAKAALNQKNFLPILSLDNKYEIDKKGHVRNSKTKRPIKFKSKNGAKYFCFQLSAHEYISRSLNDLLWEVHGVIKKSRFKPCPVSCENEYGKHFFPTMKACARFIQLQTGYGLKRVYDQLCMKRKTEVFGWKITYLDDDPYYNDYALADAKTPTEVYR